MERSQVLLIALLCVVSSSQSWIAGRAELELRVRQGDNVTLYCDRVRKPNYKLVWFRNCSHEHQPPFILVGVDILTEDYPRYSAVFNSTSNTYDLEIRNVTGADLGVYYCAMHEKTFSGHLVPMDVYHYGSRSTRLSLLEEARPCTSEPFVAGGSCSWQLWVSVCAVCVLLSSVLSSVSVYFLCRKTTKADLKSSQEGNNKRNQTEVRGDVCYASLDVQKLNRQRKKKKQRVQQSDFSTYSEVRMTECRNLTTDNFVFV